MKLLIEVEVPDDVAGDDPDGLARYLLDPRADDPVAVLVRARFAGLDQRHKEDGKGPGVIEGSAGEQCPTCRVAYLAAGHAAWCPNWVAPITVVPQPADADGREVIDKIRAALAAHDAQQGD